MDVLIAVCVATATICAIWGVAPRPIAPAGQRPSLFDRFVERRGRDLRAARLHVDARRFSLACILSPPALFVAGLVLGSPIVAIVGAAAGLLAPRLYLDHLVRAQRRRTESQAPRLLQVLVASLTAGRTYLEALEEARRHVSDRWLRADLDHVITQLHLDVPMEQSIAEVRTATAGRNLGLVWDNLAICVANRIPASRATGVLVELSSTVQFNVQIQQEVQAKTSGQRVQIWLLAAIVPALFLYLKLLNPEFFTILDTTLLGKVVILPGAVALEALGLYLSFRVARVEGA